WLGTEELKLLFRRANRSRWLTRMLKQMGLRPTQDGFQEPAAPRMRPRPATMREDLLLAAASFFEGVGQDGQVLELAFVVDHCPDRYNGGRPPRRVEQDWMEWGRDDIT